MDQDQLFSDESQSKGNNVPHEILPYGGSAKYYPSCLGNLKAADVFGNLYSDTPWETYTIRMFGKVSEQPRQVAWYGDPGSGYSYSGLKMNIRNWTPLILQLKNICQQFAEQEFNSVLLNLYRDGSDKVGWHSDNEPELGYEPTIASLSLGAARRFKFRLREDHDVKEEIILPSGSLVVMSGPCQQLWDHEIPKELKIKTPRINLTFRRVNVKG